MIRPLAFSLVVAAVTCGSALAQSTPVLRTQITAQTDILTIGDFFEHAGAVADTPLYRAPDLGKTGHVPAQDIIARATGSGLQEPAPIKMANVVVHRHSLKITANHLEDLIALHIAEKIGAIDSRNIEIRLLGKPEVQHADPTSETPFSLGNLDWSERTGRFSALVRIQTGLREKVLTVSGVGTELVEVPTLTHGIRRGEIVSKADISITRVARNALTGRVASNLDAVIGMAAKRTLRGNSVLRETDFEPPILVSRGEKVTIVYRVKGLLLTARGKASSPGAKDDLITVVNLQSNRSIQATVTADGQVIVNPNLPLIAQITELKQ
ncbi:MAG: flagellar basal body P-ring formation chaperone FlgA [Stappiaceae bacterium]